jgi:hypothetical protein
MGRARKPPRRQRPNLSQNAIDTTEDLVQKEVGLDLRRPRRRIPYLDPRPSLDACHFTAQAVEKQCPLRRCADVQRQNQRRFNTGWLHSCG